MFSLGGYQQKVLKFKFKPLALGQEAQKLFHGLFVFRMTGNGLLFYGFINYF